MLRSVDDEVRASVARAPHRFLDLWSKPEEGQPPSSREELFDRAVKPFFEQIWPLERSLVTRGVAAAFASLPSACGSAFSEAVTLVERFLVPIDAWSLVDYGIYDPSGDASKITGIVTADDARALLRLLDKTIGFSETARVPYDLDAALEHVRKIDPKIEASSEYGRLSALSRRQ
jgi:hypothetical protein